ncbi:MAG TPA: TonB-dependent receptor [Candidatus Parabacteroides intestinavium]|nr:TonB-dependent receptor [Candidatus Parabacteroides intestinavium]
MIKKIEIIIVSCFCIQFLYGVEMQEKKVTGRIIDKTSEQPVEFADVALYRVVDSVFVAGCVTDADGRFSFAAVSAGYYYVECSFIGYETSRSSAFTIAGQKGFNVDKLYLRPSSEQLDEVVVQGRRSTYEQHIDRRVFNVGSDLMSTSGSVSDLMRNIPSVQVDVEGHVSLRGSENVNILIDGKPSTLMNARTRADALRQIPASEIERIEVITNPSAAYKPDGVSGIINLILKKEKQKGWSGNASANVGTGGRRNATLSAAYNAGNITLSASYGIRRDLYEPHISDNRTRNDSTLAYTSQLTTSRAHPVSHIVRAGVDWKMDRNDRLQVNGNYTRTHFIRTENIYTTDLNARQDITYQGVRYRYDNENVKGWEVGSSYTHTFGKDHELTADYSYSSLEGLEDNQYATYSTDSTTKDNTQIWQAYYQHLFHLTYHRQFNEHLKLDIGYELDALQTDLNFHVQNLEGDVFVPDRNRTNDFTNNETNHALYATVEYKQGAWGLLFGIRPELMRIKSHLHSLDSIVTNDYWMVYPTLHVSYAIDEWNELQLNYSLRVNRPEADDLNPFPEYQNPLSLRVGNPYLKPEKVHSVEAGYQWRKGGTTVLGTLYYRYVTHKLTAVTRYLPTGVLLTTKENLNNGSSAGAEFILNTAVGKWLTLNMNGNLFYDQIDATRLGYGSRKDAVAWSASLNADFTPFKNALIQLNSRYLSPSLMAQGKREGTFTTDIGAKYEIPRLHLSFTATLSDVFNTFKKVYTIDTPQLQQRLEQKMNTRMFYIGFTWNFNTLKQK